jgi:hypothetical protein
MKCTTMLEWFSERIDGTLDPDRSARLDQHLAQCADCLAEFESLRLAVGRLREAGPPATTVDERASIMAAIDREAEDRLVTSTVGGEALERRSGVFKRAILLPQAEPTPRRMRALFTHVASFAVGIAAAALFWFNGSHAEPSATPIEPTTEAHAPAVDVVTTPAQPIPRSTPAIETPAPSVSPPAEMLLRVSGDLTVVHNGQRGADSAGPLTLRPGDIVEAQSVGKWRIIVGSHGALEVQSEPAPPAPIQPTVSRGPMIAIDLDPAPLQRLAAGMRTSLEQLAVAMDRAAERMPRPPQPELEAPTIHAPEPKPVPLPRTEPRPENVVASIPTTPSVNDASPMTTGAPSAFSPRPPVVVRQDESDLRLETVGSPLEVVPALIQRLRDEDTRVVALVIARLELVREEFERDPKFPRVAPRTQTAAVDPSWFGLVTSLVVASPHAPVAEEPFAYWNRWFDACADAIIARETYGTW